MARSIATVARMIERVCVPNWLTMAVGTVGARGCAAAVACLEQMAFGAVAGHDLLSPRQQVCSALAGGLRASPELEIVDGVPRAVAIAVVHALALAQWPAKVLLHHIAVFQNLPAVDRDNPVAVTGAAPCPARCSQRVGATENASPSAPLIVHAAKAVTLREAPASGDLTRNALTFACHSSHRTGITVGTPPPVVSTAKALGLDLLKAPINLADEPFRGLVDQICWPKLPCR